MTTAPEYRQAVLPLVEQEIRNGKIGDETHRRVLLTILPALPALEPYLEPAISKGAHIEVIPCCVVPAQVCGGPQCRAYVNESVRSPAGNAQYRATNDPGSDPED